MNKIFSFFLIISFSAITACEPSSNESARLNLVVPIDISAGLGTIETHVYQVYNVPTFFEQVINSSNISEASIVGIESSFGLFRSKFGGIDLDFVQGITVHVLVDTQTGERKELFYLDTVPFGSKDEIKMLASVTELKELLNKEVVDLELSLRFRQIPSNTFTGEFDLSFGIFTD